MEHAMPGMEYAMSDSRWSVEHGVPTEVEYLLTTKRLKLHILAEISSL